MSNTKYFFQYTRDFIRKAGRCNADVRLTKARPIFHDHLRMEVSRWQVTAHHLWHRISLRVAVLSELFARQCSAIAAQRIRRTVQIVSLYGNLGYDRHTVKTVIERLGRAIIRKIPKYNLLMGLSVFAVEKNRITDDEITGVADEILHVSRDSKGHLTSSDNNLNVWECVVDKSNITVWRKPVSNSYLYEYKVFGTFSDIPARAFFRAQVDLEFRKQWDKLVINLDVVDKDDSGTEVVHWIMHYPYPMYGREYVYVRKCVVDADRNVMVIVNRSVDHPTIPTNKQFVRVNTYMSKMVIRPYTSFDESGFDYILTYYDDPQAAFPSFAYNWMASTGVPDFVSKVHAAAKILHERKKPGTKGVASQNEEQTPEQQSIPM